MNIHWLRRAGALAVAGAAACSAAQPGAPRSSTPASPAARSARASAPASGAPGAGHTAACRASQLKITLARSGAGLGHVTGHLRFTNQSSTPCHLMGWPAVSGVTAARKTGTAAHTRTPWSGPAITTIPLVTLGPRESAEAVLNASDNPRRAGGCPPPYKWLRVTPPGGTQSTMVSAWIPYLGAYLPACSALDVSPVIPASRAS